MARACGKLSLSPQLLLVVMHVSQCLKKGVFLQVGGFLSFNLLFPSDRPDIPRLMG